MELLDPWKMLKQREANKIALILIRIHQRPWVIPISGTKLRNPWKRTVTCYILCFLFVVCFSFTEAIINQELSSEGHSHLFLCLFKFYQLYMIQRSTAWSLNWPPPLLRNVPSCPTPYLCSIYVQHTYCILLFVPVPSFLFFPTRLISWRTELMSLWTSLPW